MRTSIDDSVARQTEILLANIRALLDLRPGLALRQEEWDFDAQLFHLLTSMDKWFESPTGERAAIVDDLRSARSRFSIDEANLYLRDLEGRIQAYLSSRPDWESHTHDAPWSRLELVLGQFRHAMHHVGYLHAWLKAHGILPPEFVGLPMPSEQPHA